MDHVLLPEYREKLKIKVPVVVDANSSYDGRGFTTFPERKGYQRSRRDLMTLDDLSSVTAEKRLQFLQSWLYFGFLHEFFGEDFVQSQFISLIKGDIDSIIDTTNLPKLIDLKRRSIPSPRRNNQFWRYLPLNWRPALSQLEELVAEERLRLEGLLSLVDRQCDELDVPLEDPTAGWCETLLALRILVEALAMLVDYKTPHSPSSNKMTVQLVENRLLELERSAWCRPQVRRICTVESWTALLFLASVRRRERPWITHSLCDKSTQCTGYNIDSLRYECRHITDGCTCKHVTAPVSDIHNILRAGDIPIVRCLKRGKSLSLSYVKASYSSYAAVSHLWADGSGNPQGNSIPYCQLDRISRIIRHRNMLKRAWWRRRIPQFFNPPVDFWLDVYCVPIIDARDSEADQAMKSELKRAALSRITATFAWAAFVVVQSCELSELREIRKLSELNPQTLKHSDLETVGVIATSGWASRCWTFEEQCLGSEVFFADGEDTIGPVTNEVPKDWAYPTLSFKTELYRQIRKLPCLGDSKGAKSQHGANLYGQILRMFCVGEDVGVKKAFTIENERTEQFRVMWNELAGRSSTKSKDGRLIFAQLMSLSTAEIAHLTPVEQMQAIVTSLKQIPVHVLFIEAMRLQDNNLEALSFDAGGSKSCNWLPLSPLGATRIPRDDMLADVTENGLLIPIKSLKDSTKAHFEMIEVTLLPGHEWTILMHYPNFGLRSLQRAWISFQDPAAFRHLLVPAPPRCQPEKIILLLRMPWLSAQSGSDREGTGACFIVQGQEGSTLQCSYVTPLKCGPVKRAGRGGAVGACMEGVTATQIASNVTSLLVKSDIRSWPKLETRRDLINTRNYSINLRGLEIVLTCYAVALGIIAAVYIGLSYGMTSFPAWDSSLPLGLAIGICTYWCEQLYREARRLIVLDSYRLEQEHGDKWWVRLDRMTPPIDRYIPSLSRKSRLLLIRCIVNMRKLFK